MTSPAASSVFAGLHILLVEDEMMLALSLQGMLEAADCEVLKAPSVTKALALAVRERFDGALLDINVRGEPVYPVASELARRGIPFVFMTGYDKGAIDVAWRNRPVLNKPFGFAALERVASDAFTAEGQA